ncbi:MAG: hypothetical protein K8F91_24560, partial [Candidatus Obscuribacterales bacterium]|nr:hypothetical protein [Candidatus Obscuribacterales bacterium]
MTKMLKFPPLKLIVFSIIFQALIATPVNSATEESDSKFAALSDQFMKEALARSPSNASQAGYHQHKDPKTGKTLALDSMLDDMSLKAAIQDREFYERFRALFAKETPLASLSPQDAADW